LSSFHVVGNNGGNGAAKGMTGRGGADKIVHVPVGTCIYKAPPSRKERQEMMQEGQMPNKELSLIADLSEPDATCIVAKGGYGGRGNIVQVAESFQFFKPMSDNARRGKPGEKKSVLLKLKTIADAGLVGFPNAGKSSLLGAISLSHPKVASYMFTTLHPHIGHVEYTDGRRVTVADLPGLVDGAHENRGLGHEFLQHVERTKVLVYVIDVCPTFEGRERSAGEDFVSLRNELELYQTGLSQRPSIIVANKMDSRNASRGLESLKRAAPSDSLIIPISTMTGVGLPEFVRALRGRVVGAID